MDHIYSFIKNAINKTLIKDVENYSTNDYHKLFDK